MLRLLEWHRLCLLQRKALWEAARLYAIALRFLRMLPFGRLWYDTPDNAIGYAMHSSRSHDALIRVYDVAGNVRLLLVEYSHVYEAFAARGDGARLSIGRYNTLSGERNLSIFLDRYFQRVVTTKFFVRPRV